MPTGLTRSPQRAAPTYSLPRPDDEEDGTQEEASLPATPASQQSLQTGSTGGVVPQQAGTWERPEQGRIADDPRLRAKQSIATAQADFEDKQRQDNPFIFSGDVKNLSKIGGRRYDARAVRAGDEAYADQTRADNAAARALRADAKLNTDTFNSRVKARFEGNGQQYYTDPLTKRLTPVLEEGTGRALYHESAWSPTQHPRTGLSVMEKRDKYGQRQYKRPTLTDSADPEDEYLYADMGDGESTPYVTKEEAAKSSDVSLAKMGLAALKKQRGARNTEALQGMLAVDAGIDQEVLGHQQQADEIQRQIDELTPKATNTGDTQVNRDAYGARIEQLNGELQRSRDALHTGGELMRRQRLSKKSIGLTRAQAALDAYQTQKAEIETRLRAKGVAPEDYDKDPLHQQNTQGLQAAQRVVANGQSSMQSEDALARRVVPAVGTVVQPGQPETPDPAPGLEGGEPFALAQRGVKNIGGVSVQQFVQRYGDGRNVTPDSLLKLAARSREITDTLANEDTRIDDKLRTSLTQEQHYADQLIKQRMARLPEDQRARVEDVLALKGEGTAKSAGKSGVRGAISEGVYSMIEGGARLLSRIPESANGVLALPKGAQKYYREYADATAQVRQQIRDALPLDQEFSKSMTGQITQGLGQAAGTLPLAVIPGGLAVASVGQIYDEGYQDAKASGATDEQANSAALKYLPAAALDYLSEKLIVGKIMKPLVGKMTVGRVLKDILASAATEGGTEGAQQAYLNQIASKLQGYDPERPFDQEVYDSMLVGAVTGGVATGVGQAGNRLRGGEPEGGNVQEPAPGSPAAPVVENMSPEQAEAEFQRRLNESDLTPEEKAEFSRLMAEGSIVNAQEAINAQQAGLSRVGRNAEDSAGIFNRNEPQVLDPAAPTKSAAESAQTLDAVRATEYAPGEARPSTAEEAANVFQQEVPQILEETPANPANESAAAILEGQARREAAQAARQIPAEALERAGPTDAIGQSPEELARREAQGLNEPSAQPTSNAPIPESPVAEPAVATPEVPESVAEEARPDVPENEGAVGRPPVVEQTPEAIAADRKKYDVLQKRMSALLKAGGADAVGSDAYQSAWQASEDIKNRHGGMPPGEVSGESAMPAEASRESSISSASEEVPSSFDLNDWVEATHPKEASAARYLSPDSQYRFHQKVWEAAGRPKIESEAAAEPSVVQSAPQAKPAAENVVQTAVQSSTPRSAEQRLNDAGSDLPPISGMSREAKRAELDAAGIKTYNGKPLDEANPAQISNAVGKLRRGELTAEGEKPGTDTRKLSDRAIEALQKAKIHKPGQLSAATPLSIAYDGALDLAILGIRAGRAVADVIKIAVARFKARHPGATEADIAKLTKAIQDAHSAPPPTPTTPKSKESKVTQSMKAAGVPVNPIAYDERNQQERKQEAAEIIRKDGREAAEAKLSDDSINGDTRVAIAGDLIADKMLSLASAKPEDIPRLTRDIQRITAKAQPSMTRAGQEIAMIGSIYKDMRVASGMEYVREVAKKRLQSMGGEEAGNAAEEAAKIFNKDLTPDERNKAIEKLKERFTTKPVRRMLNEFKRMETAKELNKLGVLTRDDMVEVAGNALGMPGIDQKRLKHLAEISDRIENAKTPAERVKAELELADTLSIYKGVNPLDLESSILTLNILSGPTTQLANLEGNALNAFAQLGTTALANPTKIGPLVSGMIDGMGLGVTQAKSILQTGRGTRDLQDKTSLAGSSLQNVDYARDFPAVGDKVGAVLTARARAVEKISRVMKAADALFYYPAREAYARMVTTKLLEGDLKGPALDKAVREHLHITPEAFKSAEAAAKAEGYEGIDLARRTSDIIEERRATTAVGKQAVKESERFAAEATYNQEPEGLAGVVYRNASSLLDEFRIGNKKFNFQALKPWLMFLKVPANVFNATTNFTPMGAIRAETGVAGPKRGEWRNFNKDERNRLYIQSAIGSALMGGLIFKVLNDEDVDVTAGGPANPTQKKQLQQGGWLPYSIKVGGKYYSYKDSPLLVPLSIVGNVADSVKYQKSKDDLLLESKVVDAIGQAPQTIFQTSMLSGFADLMSSLSSKNGAQGMGRSLAGVPANLVIPYNRLLQQIDQIFDKQQYDVNPVQRNVPFARRNGPVKTDVQGRPETYDPFSRFGSPESKDPLDALIRDKQVFVPDVTSAQKMGNRAMTDEERTEFRRISGQRIRSRLMGMVPTLRSLDKEKAQDAIDRVAREERDRAKSMMGRMPVKR